VDSSNSYAAFTRRDIRRCTPASGADGTCRGRAVARAVVAVLALIALLYVGACFTPVIFRRQRGTLCRAVREMHQRR